MPQTNFDNEALRLQVIAELGLRQTGRFQACDDIIGLLQAASHRPIALFTIVDHDRLWFHASRGTDAGDQARSLSPCELVISEGDSDQPFTIGDLHNDKRVENNPLIGGLDNVRFYAALPVRVEGIAIGTVAIADHKPGRLSPAMAEALQRSRRAIEHCLRTETAAYIDRISGLYNRRYFDTQMQREWRRAHRGLIPLTIVMIEIDYLVQLHQLRDPAQEQRHTRAIVDVIHAGLQRPADIIARYDDRRIVAVLPDTDTAGTHYVVNDLRDRFVAFAVTQEEIPDELLSVNIGAAVVIVDDRIGASYHGILRAAETALEQSRKAGPNMVAVRDE